MDPITLNGARQSLMEAGFRFTTPITHPTVGFPEGVRQADGRWPRGATTTLIPDSLRQHVLEQLVIKQRHEMARLLLQERALRQEIAAKDQRIQQLDRRTRHPRQTRDLLIGLHLRIDKIEGHLGLPQVAFSTRHAQMEERYFGDDPPRFTAEQGN